jgi:hypothetical protein
MEAAAYRDADHASAIHSILATQEPSKERDHNVRGMMLELCESLDLRAAQVSDLLGKIRFLEEDSMRKPCKKRKTECKTIFAALLDRVERADVASMFVDPVSTEIQGYYERIKNPMDLSTMRRRLPSYSSITEFEQDLTLIIDNCLKFNGEHSFVGQYAVETAREWKQTTDAARKLV